MVPGDDDRGRQVRPGFLGFDRARPWVALLPEPSAPPPTSRFEAIWRLSIQIKGLTVGQFPNAPLWLWLGASAIAWLTSGTVQDVAAIAALGGLLWWALAEILRGVNWYRRVLGAVVLVVTAVGLLA